MLGLRKKARAVVGAGFELLESVDLACFWMYTFRPATGQCCPFVAIMTGSFVSRALSAFNSFPRHFTFPRRMRTTSVLDLSSKKKHICGQFTKKPRVPCCQSSTKSRSRPPVADAVDCCDQSRPANGAGHPSQKLQITCICHLHLQASSLDFAASC